MSSRIYETLIFEVSSGVATITLNRPDRLNAATPEMADELIEVLNSVNQNDSIRAVIITGSGRAFCAGADLSAVTMMNGRETESTEVVPDWGGRVALQLYASLKPVICAINGPAVGIGATLPLAMDFRLASTTARFSYPFVRLGIVPESASSWFLPRIVGIARALDWCLTGRQVSASEALASGLVQSIHEPDDLLVAAQSMAIKIADSAAPVSIALTRQLLWRMSHAEGPADAHELESIALHHRRSSCDFREGVEAFLSKRTPDFSDKVSADLLDIFSASCD